MKNCSDAIYQRIVNIATENEHTLNLLYYAPCTYERCILLSQLRSRLWEMYSLCSCLKAECDSVRYCIGESVLQPYRDITKEELIKYDGKNGNPAFVAVNGVVYDVTDNAAWGAASHFGLTAGKDLTREFASCHAGQQILGKLKVVGKLVG